MGLYTLTVGAEDEEALLEGIGIIETLKWKNPPVDAKPTLAMIDLGDFTLAVDPNMPGEIQEKADQTSFFMAYPNYDENAEFHSNFNIVWTQAYDDVTAQDPEALTRQIMEKTAAELADSGIAVDNLQFIQAAVDEVDGKPALFAMYAMDLDYSGTGYDLQCTVVYAQVITGSEEMGLYTFTAGATDEEGLMAGVNIIDTLKWK